jgi:hypothetical protein
MRNKTTKKYKRNNRKTRKIRGGGVFDGITTMFKRTSDTNKDMSQIKELKTTLANNMKQLTETYENVLKKVNTLHSKIDDLSDINDKCKTMYPSSFNNEVEKKETTPVENGTKENEPVENGTKENEPTKNESFEKGLYNLIGYDNKQPSKPEGDNTFTTPVENGTKENEPTKNESFEKGLYNLIGYDNKQPSKPEGDNTQPSNPEGDNMFTTQQSKPEGDNMFTTQQSKPEGDNMFTTQPSKSEGDMFDTNQPSEGYNMVGYETKPASEGGKHKSRRKRRGCKR